MTVPWTRKFFKLDIQNCIYLERCNFSFFIRLSKRSKTDFFIEDGNGYASNLRWSNEENFLVVCPNYF